MDFLLVIPARYASSRFLGKPLADLCGMSVLQHVVKRCTAAVGSEHVVVATDDDRIEDHCNDIGVVCERTSAACWTGTDRVAEVASRIRADWYLNVQGDEPFVDPEGIRTVLAATSSTDHDIINAMAEIRDEFEFRSATVPKVVVDQQQRLLYMSRAAIPTNKAVGFVRAHRQVGLYAFRRPVLEAMRERVSKSPLEAMEDIEILYFLEAGYSIRMVLVDAPGIAVDTPSDLKRARAAVALES